MRNKFRAAIVMGSFLGLFNSVAALYPGNGNDSYGGAIGNGSLNLTDKGSWMSATFNKGGGSGVSFHGDMVIFIDSAPGGFNTTSQFTENDTELFRAISGLSQNG